MAEERNVFPETEEQKRYVKALTEVFGGYCGHILDPGERILWCLACKEFVCEACSFGNGRCCTKCAAWSIKCYEEGRKATREITAASSNERITSMVYPVRLYEDIPRDDEEDIPTGEGDSEDLGKPDQPVESPEKKTEPPAEPSETKTEHPIDPTEIKSEQPVEKKIKLEENE